MNVRDMVVEPGAGNTDAGIAQIVSILVAVSACCMAMVDWDEEQEGWMCAECCTLLMRPPSFDSQGEANVFAIGMPNIGVTIEEWVKFWLNVDDEHLKVEVS